MVILLAGNIGDGKDTSCNIIQEYLLGKDIESYVGRFAELPKKQCAQILGLDWDTFNSHDNPNKSLYREYYKNHAELLKQVYGVDVWAKALKNQYLKKGGVMIVPDVRFQHEIDAFADVDSVSIRIKRMASPKEWGMIYGVTAEGLLRFYSHNNFIHVSDIRNIYNEYCKDEDLTGFQNYMYNNYPNWDKSQLDLLGKTLNAPSEIHVDNLTVDYTVSNWVLTAMKKELIKIIDNFI